MRLIVVSDPDFIQGEAPIINKLFNVGLRYLHLRKPDCSREDLSSLIGKVDPRYYDRISLHQHHALAGVFGISRLHFTERSRQETSDMSLKNLSNAGFTLSTSVHDLSRVATLSDVFSYTFFGPVFNSISKTGYQGITGSGFFLDDNSRKIKVIGIGGINEVNITKLRRMNFDGAAVLGALWKDPKKGIEHFLKLQAKILSQ